MAGAGVAPGAPDAARPAGEMGVLRPLGKMRPPEKFCCNKLEPH